VRSQVSPRKFYEKQSGTETNLPPSTAVFPGQCHSTSVPHSSSSACFSYHKEKCAKHANLPKENTELDRKVLSCFVSLRRDSRFCKVKLRLAGCQFKLNISLHSATILITQERHSFSFQIYSVFHNHFLWRAHF
jgi:hypothetical protein